MAYQDPHYSKALGFIRRLLVVISILAVMYFARPEPVWLAIGALITAMGEAVRWWAAGHLLKTKELVISGPYRYTRNPLYLGRFLILTGLSVAATMPYRANWILLVLGWIFFFGYYLRRKERVEPARLREFHGEAYDRYFKSVPALFPSFKAYAATSDLKWSRERMLRNREHWMVLGLSLAYAFLYWKSLMG